MELKYFTDFTNGSSRKQKIHKDKQMELRNIKENSRQLIVDFPFPQINGLSRIHFFWRQDALGTSLPVLSHFMLNKQYRCSQDPKRLRLTLGSDFLLAATLGREFIKKTQVNCDLKELTEPFLKQNLLWKSRDDIGRGLGCSRIFPQILSLFFSIVNLKLYESTLQ
jgi:hypothetical protein